MTSQMEPGSTQSCEGSESISSESKTLQASDTPNEFVQCEMHPNGEKTIGVQSILISSESSCVMRQSEIVSNQRENSPLPCIVSHSSAFINDDKNSLLGTSLSTVIRKTLTDVEAYNNTAVLQKSLVAELDEKLENCTQLSDLPQYLSLKQLCGHLQTMVEQLLAKQERLQAQNERLAQQFLSPSTAPADVSSSQKTESQTSAARILVLESTVERLKKELDAAKTATVSREASIKRQLDVCKAESGAKFDALNRQYEDCKRDKDTMVLRYAQAEQRNMELHDSVQKAETRIKDWSRERENALTKWNTMRADNTRMSKSLETNNAELLSLKRDLDHQKELTSSADVQAKFHQNCLKEEIERHKETKSKLDSSVQMFKEMSDDLEQVGRDIRGLNVFLEAQKMAGFPLTSPQVNDALRDVLQKQEKNVRHEACTTLLDEVAGLLRKQKELTDELIGYQHKVVTLESDRELFTVCIGNLETRLRDHQQGTGDLEDKAAKYDGLNEELMVLTSKINELRNKLTKVEQARDELIAELEGHRKRESESLEFTERITTLNSQLQSDNLHLNSEVQLLKSENEHLSKQLETSTRHNCFISEKLHGTRAQEELLGVKLTRELTEHAQLVKDLKQKIQDLENEIKTVNRRHASNNKDLMRQLQAANRRLESLDGKGSLSHGQESVGETSSPHSSGPTNSVIENEETANPVVEVIKVDRKMLLDKIVSLQKKLARKNEKIDFLQDHVTHLVDDINMKSRIIQEYVLTQDAGVMSSEKSDKVKAQLARKGGVMASLYNAHRQDNERTMTVEFALEICNKLQALLEDTLLKNITLKENMDTLGHQVDVLLKENRRLLERSAGTQSLVELDS